MKSTLILILAIVCSTIYFNGNSNTSATNDRVPASVRTPQTLTSCAYSPGDIAPVTGHGSDIHKARSAASKVCFERRIDLFEKTRNAFPSTAQGQLIIDSCINIKCK